MATIVPAYAVVESGGEISPHALYYRNASASLSISSSGMASLTSEIAGIVGTTTKTTVHMYLQKYEDGDWVEVDED